MSSSVHLRPKLNLVDVEYLRNNVELLFDTPSPPSGPQGKTVSPKKKNAKLKESKGSTKKKKKGGKGKGGKKKKKGELEAERAVCITWIHIGFLKKSPRVCGCEMGTFFL